MTKIEPVFYIRILRVSVDLIHVTIDALRCVMRLSDSRPIMLVAIRLDCVAMNFEDGCKVEQCFHLNQGPLKYP